MELENPTPYEEGWLKVMDDLRNSAGIQVSRDTQGAVDLTAEDSAFDDLEEWEGVKLDQSFRGHYVRFSELGIQWETVEPYEFVSGEFYLTPLPQAVHEEPPEFSSSLHSDEEQEMAAELRIIDEGPITGTGFFAALRLQAGIQNPEVWFSDGRQNLWKMDVDYREYLAALQITKGSFDWQHLFTEAPLTSEEYESSARRLKNMLAALPRIFPDHDYSDLRARLEARL